VKGKGRGRTAGGEGGGRGGRDKAGRPPHAGQQGIFDWAGFLFCWQRGREGVVGGVNSLHHPDTVDPYVLQNTYREKLAADVAAVAAVAETAIIILVAKHTHTMPLSPNPLLLAISQAKFHSIHC